MERYTSWIYRPSSRDSGTTSRPRRRSDASRSSSPVRVQAMPSTGTPTKSESSSRETTAESSRSSTTTKTTITSRRSFQYASNCVNDNYKEYIFIFDGKCESFPNKSLGNIVPCRNSDLESCNLKIKEGNSNYNFVFIFNSFQSFIIFNLLYLLSFN